MISRPAPPSSGDSNVTNGSFKPRQRRRRKKLQNQDSQQSAHALLWLIGFMVMAVLIEIVVVDHLLLSPLHEENVHASSSAQSFPQDLPNRQNSDTIVEQAGDKNGQALHNLGDHGKLRSVVEILTSAGIEVTEDLLKKLPTSEDVQSLYGNEPVILGLETCEAFRNTIKNEDAYIAPAGMFNTGTNLMAVLLQMNCYLPERVKKHGKESRGMRFQVPWGKHSPAKWRLGHVAQAGGADMIQTDVLPVVVVKDPYTWMASMCRHPYSLVWPHDEKHCPNLVAQRPSDISNKRDAHIFRPGHRNQMGKPVEVQIHYRQDNITHHTSMAHLWNDWYEPYVLKELSYPRLVVRFEDLLFHAEEVVSQACHCGGGQMSKPFRYSAESAKKGGSHAGSSGLVSSMTRYANATLRIHPFTLEDLQYAKDNLHPGIMDIFNYHHPVTRGRTRP